MYCTIACADGDYLDEKIPQFGKCIATIENWSKSFDWQDRIRLRDQEIAKRLEKKTINSVTHEKAKLLNILRSTINNVVDEINEKKFQGIQTQKDLIDTVIAILKVMGEDTTNLPQIVELIWTDKNGNGTKPSKPAENS